MSSAITTFCVCIGVVGANRFDMDNSDEEDKEMQKKIFNIRCRINNTEQIFGNLCMSFGSYSRSLAKCRDRNDKVAKELNTLASNERLNVTTRSSLMDFVKNYSAVQDHLDIKIKRIRQNVIQPLSFYDTFCKQTKKSSHQTYSALKKELELKKRLSRLQRTRAYQNLLESKISHSLANSTKLKKQLKEEMESFEKKKLTDLKKMLMAVVSAEIDFSLKSLQFFTNCYKNLEGMNEDADLNQFHEHICGALKLTDDHPTSSETPATTIPPFSTLNGSTLRETLRSNGSLDSKKSPKKPSFDDHDEDSDDDDIDKLSNTGLAEVSDDDDDDDEYNNFAQPVD